LGKHIHEPLQRDENKTNVFAKWNIICKPKGQGGLGIEMFELKNKCLIAHIIK
jgi:hypothetical protein